VRQICDDLEAEHDALDALVSGLGPEGWDTPTPAEGWAVRDQITHLAGTDVAARWAVTDGEEWRAEVALPKAERERRQLETARRLTPPSCSRGGARAAEPWSMSFGPSRPAPASPGTARP